MIAKCTDCGKVRVWCAFKDGLCYGCKVAELSRITANSAARKEEILAVNTRFLRNNPDNIYRAVAELCYLMNVEM